MGIYPDEKNEREEESGVSRTTALEIQHKYSASDQEVREQLWSESEARLGSYNTQSSTQGSNKWVCAPKTARVGNRSCDDKHNSSFEC